MKSNFAARLLWLPLQLVASVAFLLIIPLAGLFAWAMLSSAWKETYTSPLSLLALEIVVLYVLGAAFAAAFTRR